MDTKVLEEIGLTNGEIKIYLALLELGSSTAGEIIRKSSMQNSVFHFCVNRIIEKGLVSYTKKGKIRIYHAADPENLIIYLKDKEKDIEEILPNLKAKQNIRKERQESEVFEGIKGVITLLNILIEDAKRGNEFLFFPADVGEKNEEIQKFYERYDWKRKSKGLTTKGIATKNLKSFFEKRKYLKMKYVDFPIPANTSICNDKMAMISWNEKPVGILIKSREIVEKQKNFFNSIWKMV